ncbi:hypothetical protein HanIR_Chr11g0502691 [Helianthus annuus]|nr:hypothetical protein HanIR_Chr11g0502691 [Helianthus annuus]
MVATTRGSSHGKQKIDETTKLIYLSSENEGRQKRRRYKETDSDVSSNSEDDSYIPKRVLDTQSSIKKRKEIVTISDGSAGYEKRRKAVKTNEILSLKTCSSPKQLYNAISCMSRRQEEAVREMGLGGLLGFVVDGIPEKLGYHVVEQYDADNLTLNIGKTELVVTASLISKLLGIREGGLSFGDLQPWKTLHPSLKG